MPGLHLVIGKESQDRLAAVEKTLPTLEHDEGYHSRVLFRSSGTIVAASGYAAYPLTIFDDEELLLVVEGMIYGLDRDGLNRSLRQLAGLLEPDRRRDDDALRSWLFEQPGDYLILIHHKRKKQWSLVSEPLARLPFYVSLKPGAAIMSRELRFVSSLQHSPSMDRLGLAQMLLFGYQCGSRTMLEGVDVLPAASLVEWDDHKCEVTSRRIHQFDFSAVPGEAGLKRAADRMTDLFEEAARKMSREKTVVGLSGGLDSRPVAVVLARAGISFEARTFLDAAGAARSDVTVARRVAESMNLNWSLHKLEPCTGREVNQIMLMKGGTNFTASAVSFAFMKKIERTFREGGIYLSGDGGDKLMPLIVPPLHLKNLADTANFAITRHALIEPKLVGSLCGLSISTLRESLIEVLDGYPEEDMVRRYVHHLMFDRTGRWSYEGEDCNRCHLWSAAPFMFLPVYQYSFSLPDNIKEQRRLHAQFLANLSETAAAIPAAGANVPVGSKAFQHRERTKRSRTRHPRLLKTVKRFLKPPVPVKNVEVLRECIKRQHATSDTLQSLLDHRHLQRLLARADRISAEGLHNLLTVTSSVLLHTGDSMLLKEFADREFD